MGQWGANTSNAAKPSWGYLTDMHRGALGNSANVFADSRGWVLRHPWGDEVLVAISDLSASLGGPVIVGALVLTSPLSNVQSTNVEVLLLTSEAVNVNGVPTIVALTNDGNAGQAANLVLSYSAALSDPSAGKLVFVNSTAGLLGNNNATVNGVITGNGSHTLTINASSTFGGQLIVDKEQDDAGNLTPANVSTTFANAYAQTMTISAYHPGLGNSSTGTGLNSAILAGAQPHPVAAQTVSFTLQYNEALTVTGTPLVLAIGTGLAANVNLAYNAASSNTTNGTLIFSNTNVSLVGDNSASFVLNSTSTLVGWDGIVGAVSGNAAQNTLGVSSNTRTIAAS